MKKKNPFKTFLKVFGGMLLTLVLLFGIFLAYASITDYKPQPEEFVTIEGSGEAIPDSLNTFSFVIWNIGYGGLGAQSDLFFDGGQGVRPDQETAKNYLNGITASVKELSADFMLLQEVDLNSRRSYHVNQADAIFAAVGGGISSFAVNYDSKFVPQPITNPYGKCLGGLQSLTRFRPYSSKRIALTPDAKWPVGLFMLDRCLLEWRFELPAGKDLVVYNLHLSAYDDGTVKQSQMDSLKALLTREYNKGNYVIAGGDWNQSPPGYKSPLPGVAATIQMNVPDVFPGEGWQWGYDTAVPTNRKLNEVYEAGKTGIDVLDFYLVSPNVEITEVKTIDYQFAHSDHQPVRMSVKLK